MKNQRNIVIKLGGSLLFNDDKSINVHELTDFCKVIQKSSIFKKIIIICGGGIIAREYINAVRGFTHNEAMCDLAGIEISRTNARLIVSALGPLAYPVIPKTMNELAQAALSDKIIVMGGLQPGQSTTSVAIEVTEYLQLKELVILTDVKGIYNKDPKKFKNAKLLPMLTYDEVYQILFQDAGREQAAAGEYRIFDEVSFQLIKRSNINVILMSGKDLTEFKKFWDGEKDFIGTMIQP